VGFARTSLEIEDRHLNSVASFRGERSYAGRFGLWRWPAIRRQGGRVAVSTNLSFLKASRSGALHAEATESPGAEKLSPGTFGSPTMRRTGGLVSGHRYITLSTFLLWWEPVGLTLNQPGMKFQPSGPRAVRLVHCLCDWAGWKCFLCRIQGVAAGAVAAESCRGLCGHAPGLRRENSSATRAIRALRRLR